MASYSASIDLQVRADRALAQIGKVEQAINRLSGIGSAGKEFKEALVPDTKQLGRLGKELDAIKNRANSTAKVFARLFEGVGTAGVTAAGLEAINAKMFELAASTGTAAASIQALDKNTGDLSRFIPGFTLLKDSVNASAFEVNKLQYGLQQFLSNTEGIREFVQNFYTMDGAAGAATAGLLALAGVLEGQLRQNLGDIEQAGNKAFKGLQEDIANNTSELNRLINATRGTADQYRNLIRLGEERRDSYNSSSREARQAINTIVRAEEKLTDELRAQADLRRAAKGVTVTELEAAKGRKSIETRQKAEAYRTEQTRLREQEEKAIQDTINALKQQRVQESAVTEEVAQRTRELNNQVRLRASILQKIQDARSARIARERSAFLQGDPQAYERPAGPGGAFRFPQADAIQAAVREQQNFNALQEEARKKAQGNLQLQYNWTKALGQRAVIAKELRDVAAADLNTQKQAAIAEERRLRLARRRKAVLTARERTQRTKQAVGEGIIGGAFPLLFGQGIGASVGGGLGGAGGGLIGGQFGFALSLLGTTLGSTFDEFNTKARDLSVALDTAGDSTQALESLLGRLDTTTSKQLSNLAASGQSAEAASLAFEKLAEKIGRSSAYAVVKAGRDFDTLSNLWQQFTTSIGAGIAQIIQEAFYLNLDVDPKTGRPPQQGPSLTEEATRRGERLTAELAIAQQLTEATRASLDKDIEKVAIIEKTIAKKQADLDLTIAANELKDRLISKKDYEKKQAIIQEKLDRNLLDIEEKRVKAVEARGKAQDRAAKQAIREAERLQREQRNIAKAKAAAQINEINAIKTLFASSIALTRQRDGELAAVEQRLKQLDMERDGQLKILEIRYEEQAQTSKSIEEHNKLYDIYMLQYQTVVNTYETEKLKTQELKSQLETYGAMARLSAAAGFNVSGELAGAFVPKGAAGILGPGSGLTDFMTGAQLAPIIEQEVALARVLEKYQEIGQAAQLTSELVTTGFIEMVSGTKTVEQVFADFLNNLADILMKAAQQMIAQYIAIGIARMFAIGGSPASFVKGVDLNQNFFTGSGIPFGGGMANGGPVSGGTPYMVGERGPELFVPRSSGTIIPNDKMMGDSSNVVVNVDASGTKVQGDNDQASQLGRVIGAAVQAELVKQKRPGGLLAGT